MKRLAVIVLAGLILSCGQSSSTAPAGQNQSSSSAATVSTYGTATYGTATYQ